MAGRADAGAAIGQSAGLPAGGLDQVGDRVDRLVGMDAERGRVIDQVGDQDERIQAELGAPLYRDALSTLGVLMMPSV